MSKGARKVFYFIVLPTFRFEMRRTSRLPFMYQLGGAPIKLFDLIPIYSKCLLCGFYSLLTNGMTWRPWTPRTITLFRSREREEAADAGPGS